MFSRQIMKITRDSKGSLQARVGHRWHVELSKKRRNDMTPETTIKRNADGSINTAFYINRGREIRSIEVHVFIRSTLKNVRALFAAKPTRYPATRSPQDKVIRRSGSLRRGQWRPRAEQPTRRPVPREPESLRSVPQKLFHGPQELPFRREC